MPSQMDRLFQQYDSLGPSLTARLKGAVNGNISRKRDLSSPAQGRRREGILITMHATSCAHNIASQLACTAASGFALLEGDGTLKYLAQPIPEEWVGKTRFNDGACDPKGRYFAGTLYSAEHGIPGQLYRYDPKDGSCVVVDPGPFFVGIEVLYQRLKAERNF